MEKIKAAEMEQKKVIQSTSQENQMYQRMIDEAAAQINEYRGFIKNLEELCKSYQSIIENNSVKISQAGRKTAGMVNALIQKREF